MTVETDTPSPDQPEKKNSKKDLTISDYELRPLQEYEVWLVITGAFEGQWWQHERRSWQKNRDLTPHILKEFNFAYNHKSNVIIVIRGIMGGGKSTVALSIAKHLQNLIKRLLNLDVKIHITFSEDETFKIISSLKRGDIVIQDEAQRQAGEGSATVKDAIFNIQENVRANQNCFIFCSPTEKGYRNACHLLVEPYGIDYANKITRIKVYSASTERPLGWALIPKFNDPDLDAYYDQRKKEHVDRILKNKGVSSVSYDEPVLAADAEKIVTYIRSKFPHVELKRKYLKIGASLVGIPGSIAYQEKAVDYALLLIEEQKALCSEDFPYAPQLEISLQHIEFNEGLFSAFVQAMQQFILSQMPSMDIKDKNPDDCAQIYEYYLEKLHPRAILRATGLRISHATVARRIIALDDFLTRPNISEKLGKVYEDVFCEYYRQQGHEVLQGGGSVPGGIDAIVDGQVWSLKCYHDDKNGSIVIRMSDISQSELQYAEGSTGLVGISFLNPFWSAESRVLIPLNRLRTEGGVKFVRPPSPKA